MVWDLRNARAPEKVCPATHVLEFQLINDTRYSQVTKKACFRSHGVSKTRISFCPVARITVRFVGTHKPLRSLAKYASLLREAASNVNSHAP